MTSILIVWAAVSAFMFVIMFVLPSLDRQLDQQQRSGKSSRKLTAPTVRNNDTVHAAV